MASNNSHFPVNALSADRSNHGLWTAPQVNCDACASPTCAKERSFSFSSRRKSQTQRSSEYTVDSNFTTPASPTSSISSCSPSEKARRMANPGKRIAQIIKLKPECVEEYKKIHAAVWPEVLKQIRNSGIRDYHIFHDPMTNWLFASFAYVGYGFADDMQRMRENKTVQEWWKLTDGMQESQVEGAKGSAEGAWWTDVECVFYAA